MKTYNQQKETTQHREKPRGKLSKLPVLDPINKVEQFLRQSRKYGNRKETTIVEATCFKVYQVTEDISVLYVPTNRPTTIVNQFGNEQKFELQITCTPIGSHNRRCVVVPINENTGGSLTSQCACRLCIAQIALLAVRKGQDAINEINKSLVGPGVVVTSPISI